MESKYAKNIKTIRKRGGGGGGRLKQQVYAESQSVKKGVLKTI